MIKTDKSGAMEWNKTYGGLLNDMAFSMVATNDNGYVLAGRTTSSGAGNSVVWLVKVDAHGTMEWNKTYGGPLTDQCWSILLTSDGGYALLCTIDGVGVAGSDVGLLKVDSLGNVEWNQTYGESAHHSLTSITTTTDGSYIFGGSTRNNLGRRDFWLAKIGESQNGSDSLLYLLISMLVALIVIVILFIRRIYQRRK